MIPFTCSCQWPRSGNYELSLPGTPSCYMHDDLPALSCEAIGAKLILHSKQGDDTHEHSLGSSPVSSRHLGQSGGTAGGEPGAAASTGGVAAIRQTTTVSSTRQDLLVLAVAALARLAIGVDRCPTRHGCSMASRRLSSLLAMEVQEAAGSAACQSRDPRPHLSHGQREPHLGRPQNPF